MSDQPLTLAALAEFHRDVILPQFKALADGQTLMNARFDQIDGHFDGIYDRFLRVDQENAFIKLGLGRVEQELGRLGQRLESVEVRFGHVKLRFGDLERGIEGLKERLGSLELAVHRLDERLSRVEKRLEELVAAEPKYAFRSDVRDLQARIDSLQSQIRSLEQRLEDAGTKS